jgi:hypothetical protein
MKPDKIYISLILLMILATVSWITSCTHKADISGIPEVCFDSQVLPIFSNNCAISGCHDGGGESDLSFDNYNDIRNAVEPYKPESSKAYQAITSTWGENKMPPSQPISKLNRTIIRLWIEQGAKETTCTPSASGYGTLEDNSAAIKAMKRLDMKSAGTDTRVH